MRDDGGKDEIQQKNVANLQLPFIKPSFLFVEDQ